MAEIQIIRSGNRTATVVERKRDSQSKDFFDLLKGVGESVPEKIKLDKTEQKENVTEEDSLDEVKDNTQQETEDVEKVECDKKEEEEQESVTLTGEEMLYLSGMAVFSVNNTENIEQVQADNIISSEIIGVQNKQEVLADSTQMIQTDGLVVDNDNREEVTGIATEVAIEEGQIPVITKSENLSIQEQAVSNLQEQISESVSEKKTEGQKENNLSESLSEITTEGNSMLQQSASVLENKSVVTSAFGSVENNNAVLHTSPETLPMDLSDTILSCIPLNAGNATLEITLEPASLGKITIKMIYEEGKAALSLISNNPQTLDILSRRAGEIAQILQEKTGQETVIYTPESQYSELDKREQEQGRHHQEQQERPKKEQTDSFAQQLRLGLI